MKEALSKISAKDARTAKNRRNKDYQSSTVLPPLSIHSKAMPVHPSKYGIILPDHDPKSLFTVRVSDQEVDSS